MATSQSATTPERDVEPEASERKPRLSLSPKLRKWLGIVVKVLLAVVAAGVYLTNGDYIFDTGAFWGSCLGVAAWLIARRRPAPSDSDKRASRRKLAWTLVSSAAFASAFVLFNLDTLGSLFGYVAMLAMTPVFLYATAIGGVRAWRLRDDMDESFAGPVYLLAGALAFVTLTNLAQFFASGVIQSFGTFFVGIGYVWTAITVYLLVRRATKRPDLYDEELEAQDEPDTADQDDQSPDPSEDSASTPQGDDDTGPLPRRPGPADAGPQPGPLLHGYGPPAAPGYYPPPPYGHYPQPHYPAQPAPGYGYSQPYPGTTYGTPHPQDTQGPAGQPNWNGSTQPVEHISPPVPPQRRPAPDDNGSPPQAEPRTDS